MLRRGRKLLGIPSPASEASCDSKRCGGRWLGSLVPPTFAELCPASVRATAQGLIFNTGRATGAFALALVRVMSKGHNVGAALGATAGFFAPAAVIVFSSCRRLAGKNQSDDTFRRALRSSGASRRMGPVAASTECCTPRAQATPLCGNWASSSKLAATSRASAAGLAMRLSVVFLMLLILLLSEGGSH
jgi:hypothetical protein